MPDGRTIELYTLKSSCLEIQIMTYGAAIISLRAPDRAGNSDDVVLGFPDLPGYAASHSSNAPAYFGSTIGRYGNRIAHAKFALDGKQFTLSKNNGENSLHGGPGGFHNVVFEAEPARNGVAFRYLSKDGEEGYPGNLSFEVRYELCGSDLKIHYRATTDKPTVLNPTNHSFFNLAGAGSGTILSHHLKLFASHFTPVDPALIPTGEIRTVTGTPLDFGNWTAIGERIHLDDEQLRRGNGYDHNFVLDDASENLKQAAALHDPAGGRVMEVWTTEPAIQFYSGNFLDGTAKGKNAVLYARHAGLCLEAQHFPDSPNHPNFPSTSLRPGQTFQSTTIYRFSTR
jgi:aldose 1-epimerase